MDMLRIKVSATGGDPIAIGLDGATPPAWRLSGWLHPPPRESYCRVD